MKNTTRWIPITLTVIFAFLLMGVFIYRQHNEAISLSNIQTADQNTDVNSSPIHDGKININTATAEDLTLLPGIGETLAKRIIEYRTQIGHFAQLEDLMNVSGIGKTRFQQICDYITLGQ